MLGLVYLVVILIGLTAVSLALTHDDGPISDHGALVLGSGGAFLTFVGVLLLLVAS